MELAQARQLDVVLVTELSRWGRSTQDLLETLNKLAGWKVSVVAMSGMTFELETPHGRMMATMLAGITPVIPPKSNRKFLAEFDKETYKWRRLIENYFGKLTENRGIAMRSCETDLSFIAIAATLIHTR